MIRNAAALIFAATLCGCAQNGGPDWPAIGAGTAIGAGVLVAAGPTTGAMAGSAIASAASVFVAVNTDADTALKAVKPINQTACLLRPWNPKSAEAQAAVIAFCAHLPDDTVGLITQIFAVIEAVDAAHSPSPNP